MRTVERDIASAMIFSREGTFLQGLKAPDQYNIYSGCWFIPGGGRDEGETMQSALVREIKEELGLDLSPYEITLLDDKGTATREKIFRETGERVLAHMRFYIHTVHIDKPAAEIAVHLADDEFIEYRWTDPKELKNLKLTPPSIELFTRLGYLG